jgi:hypothetical protein
VANTNRNSFRVALAPGGGMLHEHLPVDISSGNDRSTGYYAEEDVPVHGMLDACASVDDGKVVGTLVASPCRARWGVSRVTRRGVYIIQTILSKQHFPLYFSSFFFSSFSLQL